MEDAVPKSDDHYFRREDRAHLWPRISAHIAAHPADLSIVLDNINRWLALGRVHPAPLLEWRDRIHAAKNSPDALLDLVSFLAPPLHHLIARFSGICRASARCATARIN